MMKKLRVLFEHITEFRTFSSRVPHLTFAFVDANPGVCPQLLLRAPIPVPQPLWENDDIIQERHKTIVSTQRIVDRTQKCVLTEGEQEGHQWIALLTSFTLLDVVHCAIISFPEVRR